MLFFLLLAGSSSCPVLTTPTARGALGQVEVKVTHSEKDCGYTCLFSATDAQLTVEIGPVTERLAETACQGGREIAPLKGIGNEAVACTVGTTEIVVGRVRNKSFLLRLTKGPRATVRDLAETVAGNLF